VLKIKNEVEEIPQSVGVCQRDNMAPVLFLFLMTAFAETLELIWKQMDILILSVMMAANKNLTNGKICSHTPAMFKSKKLTAYEILQCLYVDVGAFPFGTREDLQQEMKLIYCHFVQFGLEMHIGRGTLESKTKSIFFPPPQFFQHLERTNTAASTIQPTFCWSNQANARCIAAQEPPPKIKHPPNNCY
jgi:hypothetical protein